MMNTGPPPIPDRADVVIVGAGTAGAAATAACAGRGLRVVCLDRGPLDEAGARWVNGVAGEAFDLAGFDRPQPPERVGDGGPFHLIAGWGPHRVRVTGHDVLEVDMRALVARLQETARERGAMVVGGLRVHSVTDGMVATEAGPIQADVVVDASGLAGVRLLGQRDVPAEDLCAAAQEVREVRDPSAARAFFARHDVPPGETLCFSGIAGGYSILNVRLHDEHVSILTGSVPALGHPSGALLLQRFVEEELWIGEKIFGGSRAIPIRRPLDLIASKRVALLGDAACQVFPAHGSGIGPGLVAASVLADTLADGGDPWDYAVRWQRAHGGLLAAYDLFRRFSQSMSTQDVIDLIQAGLLDEASVCDGLVQRMPSAPPLATLPAKLLGLARLPRLAAGFAGVAARMVAAQALYARYPERPKDLPTWSRRARQLLGEG